MNDKDIVLEFTAIIRILLVFGGIVKTPNSEQPDSELVDLGPS